VRFFCQVAQTNRSNADALRGFFGQADGKDASKMCKQSYDVIYSVFPCMSGESRVFCSLLFTLLSALEQKGFVKIP
ncbi:hypothetical protein MR988_06865, partial [bacterium]|nr:hypothetical protein [bacterium]